MATRFSTLSILLVAFLAALAAPTSLSAAGAPALFTPAAAPAFDLQLKALFTTENDCPVLPPPTADNLCGSCCPFCSSVPACLGKPLGTACDNAGGRCQARTGCALYNCCGCG